MRWCCCTALISGVGTVCHMWSCSPNSHSHRLMCSTPAHSNKQATNRIRCERSTQEVYRAILGDQRTVSSPSRHLLEELPIGQQSLIHDDAKVGRVGLVACLLNRVGQVHHLL